MTETFKFEELYVYKEALVLINLVYDTTDTWKKEELFGLTSQFRRAVVSIALNIAEGSSRGKKDFRHFLDIAKGSCYECVTIITIAKQRKYITDEQYIKMYSLCLRLAKMISKLKSSLQITNNK